MPAITPISKSTDFDFWFEDLIAEIRSDQLQLETDTAHSEKRRVYETMMRGGKDETMALARETSSRHFVVELIKFYTNCLIRELGEGVKKIKLSVALSDATILIWATIPDGDERYEDALFSAEAEANARFHKYGFCISSTIIEDSDGLEAPSHYSQLV